MVQKVQVPVEVPQIQYEDQVVQVPIQKQAQLGSEGSLFLWCWRLQNGLWMSFYLQ